MPPISEYQQLRDLLISPEVNTLQSLENDVEALKHQIRDPREFARLLEPILADILRYGDPEISLAIVKAITPVIDQAIREKTRQDAAGMSDALAPASTSAIALYYASSPKEAAHDIAPLVSGAIKEQIRGERDAMIDALYPIIGSTISKYLSQTLTDLVRTIDRKIESNFTFKGLSRKIRSRMSGVSEAELLLSESISMRVEAAFLIHKTSGLVIAQSQGPDTAALDPDLLSGMLTAIRSLFNDSMNSAQQARELDQIEYGEWKIILESAGYCYLAVVVHGIPDKGLRNSMRKTLASIAQMPENTVERYTGDIANIPEEIPHAVSELVRHAQAGSAASEKKKAPWAFFVAFGVVLLAIVIPLGLKFTRDAQDRRNEAKAAEVLQTAAPMPLRGISVSAHRDLLELFGTTPNAYQRDKADAVIKSAFPGLTIENHISADPTPPLPALVNRRAEEIASALNALEGVFLNAKVTKDHLVITGFLPDSLLRTSIITSFAEIPGIRSFDCKLAEGVPELAARIYFETNSSTVRPGQLAQLYDVKEVLQRAPWSHIQIIGHSDPNGSETHNHELATWRAESVYWTLVNLGFPHDRLHPVAAEGLPTGTTPSDPDSMSRCVLFSLIHPQTTASQ
jgi:outer membrane protein OmpA-like peptidoglycan-associated protein